MDIDLPEHMGSDFLSALLDEIRTLPSPWHKMNKRQQDEVIDRLRARIEENVDKMIMVVCSEDRPCLVGHVEKVEFKGGVKASINLSRDNPNRHQLADAVGQEIMIIVSESVEAYTGGMYDIQGEPDQGELDGVE